jgi:hypothetical protein
MNIMPCCPSAKKQKQPSVTSDVPVTLPSLEVPVTSPLPAVTPNVEIAQPASVDHPNITTPFELFYGVKPDYRNLFKWGSVGYYRRTTDSGITRNSFDMQTSRGIAIGRSNQTNGMIFWDPITSRMNVSADY